MRRGPAMGDKSLALDEGLRASLRAIAAGRKNAEGWTNLPHKIALTTAVTLRSLGMIETLPALVLPGARAPVALVRLTEDGKREAGLFPAVRA
jgi:hypothetical protein